MEYLSLNFTPFAHKREPNDRARVSWSNCSGWQPTERGTISIAWNECQPLTIISIYVDMCRRERSIILLSQVVEIFVEIFHVKIHTHRKSYARIHKSRRQIVVSTTSLFLYSVCSVFVHEWYLPRCHPIAHRYTCICVWSGMPEHDPTLEYSWNWFLSSSGFGYSIQLGCHYQKKIVFDYFDKCEIPAYGVADVIHTVYYFILKYLCTHFSVLRVAMPTDQTYANTRSNKLRRPNAIEP